MKRLLLLASLTALATACGGGGDSSAPPPVSTQTYPLAQTFRDENKANFTRVLTGTTNGVGYAITMTHVAGKENFRGSIRDFYDETDVPSVNGNKLASTTGRYYYDLASTNYYGTKSLIVTSSIPLPELVKIGDSGTWYAATGASPPGTETATWSVDADTRGANICFHITERDTAANITVTGDQCYVVNNLGAVVQRTLQARVSGLLILVSQF